MKINLTNLALSNNLISFDIINLDTFGLSDLENLLRNYTIRNKFFLLCNKFHLLCFHYLGKHYLTRVFPIIYKLNFLSHMYYLHIFDSSGEYMGCHEFSIYNYKNSLLFYIIRNDIINRCREWHSITEIESSIFYFCVNNKKNIF
jgi:hypothetical protein